jgi:NADH dehydrogenase
MLYTPLLPGAAAGTLEPRHVVVPLREELEYTELRLGRVTGATPEDNTLQVELIEGRKTDIHYDQLIVALGSVSRTLPIPGLAEHAIGFKTLSEAIALRNRVLLTFEIAEAIDDDAARAQYLTYVFVGAGYAGLEGLAELQDFAADVIDLYPRCRVQGMRWILVEKGERVMPEIKVPLAAFAERELRGRGIEILTSSTIDRVTDSAVEITGPDGAGEVVPCRTVAWTAGVKPHPVVANLGLPIGRAGRIAVDEYMQVDGFDDVWAIGDAAAVPDPARKGELCPPTCQHSLRQGRNVARNVAATLGSGKKKKFSYKTLGVFVDMGRQKAVAQTLFLRWRGFPAWWLARTYHLWMMPGVKRKWRLLADWTVDLLFSRDASELGQLGHPPTLETMQLEAQSSGGSTAEGSSAPVPDAVTLPSS